MKKFIGVITFLKTVIKYGAVIFAVIEVLEFAVNKFENLELKDKD